MANRKLSGKYAVAADTPKLSPEEMRNIGQYGLALFKSATERKVDMWNPEQVKAGICDYFEHCYKTDNKPGNLGLYAWLGCSKQQINDHMTGRIGSRKYPEETIQLLRQAQNTLGALREKMSVDGQLNPVLSIWYSKNFDGMKDQQQLEVVHEERQQLTVEDVINLVPVESEDQKQIGEVYERPAITDSTNIADLLPVESDEN